jgi:hypothetical protein
MFEGAGGVPTSNRRSSSRYTVPSSTCWNSATWVVLGESPAIVVILNLAVTVCLVCPYTNKK